MFSSSTSLICLNEPSSQPNNMTVCHCQINTQIEYTKPFGDKWQMHILQIFILQHWFDLCTRPNSILTQYFKSDNVKVLNVKYRTHCVETSNQIRSDNNPFYFDISNTIFKLIIRGQFLTEVCLCNFEKMIVHKKCKQIKKF